MSATCPRRRPLLAVLAMVLACPAVALGQYSGLGTRALGMGGAFVGVADDATAVFWNPAGLGGAVVIGASADWGTARTRPATPPEVSPADRWASRGDTRLLAFALPPIGLSYFRLGHAGVAAVGPAVQDRDGRQITGGSVAGDAPAGRSVQFERVETRQAGLTLVQSLADGLVVGTTVRFVEGLVASGSAVAGSSWPSLLDQAARLEAKGERRVDLDVGVMASGGSVRAGLLLRNVRQPAFALPDGREVVLRRQARVGVAYGPGWPGRSPLVVSADADLTRHGLSGPGRRDAAAGVEGWGVDHRLGVRAGVRFSTLGQRRPVGTLGLSLGLTPVWFLDAHVARGRDGADRAWSLGGRFAY